MTVKELKEFLSNIPDETEVKIYGTEKERDFNVSDYYFCHISEHNELIIYPE